MQKKGVELSMNVIIIAAIALVVLVILVVLVLNQAGKVSPATECTGGQCLSSCDPTTQVVDPINKCSTEGQVCCRSKL
jgi:uncharacterized protein YoxC